MPGAANPPNGPDGSASNTNPGGAGATGPASDGSTRDAASAKDKREQVAPAAKSAVGTDDSLLLAALVLGFTFAVSGVVMAAGLRGGRRVR